MNPYLKLIAATGVVAGGFFVARLMGDPEVRHKAADSVGRLAQMVGPSAKPPVAPPGPLTNNARLIPDADAAQLAKSPPLELPSTVAPPLFSNEPMTVARPVPTGLPPIAAMNAPTTAPPLAQVNVPQVAPSLPATERLPPVGISPRGRLRDEAPRALEFDRQPENLATSTVTTEPRRLPPTTFAPMPDTQALAPPPLAQGFTPPHAASGAAMSASYESPGLNQAAPLLAPPPWPGEQEEVAEARSHVVKDGDSLARLAALYLGDERRGREIYEVNRAVLADPELLPIGVELAIPQRSASTIMPQATDTFADRSVPRAQLLRPLPVEPPGVIHRASQ